MTGIFEGRELSVGIYRVLFEVKNGLYENQQILRTRFRGGHSWVECYSIEGGELQEVCSWITSTDPDDVVLRKLDGFTDSRTLDK